MHISIIIPSTRPKHLALTLDAIHRQETTCSYNIIIIQESENNHAEFGHILYPAGCQVIRRIMAHDYGASAKDHGLRLACGDYVVFWDDDNLYHEYALQAQYVASIGHDIGIVQTIHHGRVIPYAHHIKLGDIDTMCLCVKRELAIKEFWSDGLGRGSDYRWVSKLLRYNPSINYSDTVIGIHL